MHNRKFLNAIICDDVRQQADGRAILLGVIGGAIFFQPPEGSSENDGGFTHDLAFYVEMLIDEDVPVDFRMVHESISAPLLEIHGTANYFASYGGRVTISLPRQIVRFPHSGCYNFQGRVSGGQWETLSQLNIVLVEDETSG